MVGVAYFPTIIGTPRYSIVSAFILIVMGVYLIYTYKEIWDDFGKYILLFTIFYLIVSFVPLLLYNKDYFTTSSNFYLSFLCFSMGYYAKDIDRGKMLLALKLYSVTACVMGLYSVFHNVGHFAITQQYAILLKNSSGVIVATASLVSLYLVLNVKTNVKKTVWIVISILCFLSVLVFRARSAIVGLLIAMFIILLKAYLDDNISKKSLFILAITLVVLFFADFLPIDLLYNSMFENKKVGNIDDFSSGRTVMYRLALSYFDQNPLAGNMATNEILRSVDNYVINLIGRYGFIGIISGIPPYLFVWWITLKGLFKSDIKDILPYAALLILCIVSLTEAPFPFGPGTPCVCAYVLLGLFINYSENDYTEDIQIPDSQN